MTHMTRYDLFDPFDRSYTGFHRFRNNAAGIRPFFVLSNDCLNSFEPKPTTNY
jgi:hypothetical protein